MTEDARRRSRISHRQTIADRLLEGLRTGDLAVIRELMDDDALIAVVAAGGRREARGKAGMGLLEETLASDRPLAGRQVVGDVHASLPTICFVLSLESGDLHTDRVVVITIPGRMVTGLTIYLLPLASAAG